MQYIVLAVASDAEAQRLVDDMSENPGQPLRTPRWGNAVHAEVVGVRAPRPGKYNRETVATAG